MFQKDLFTFACGVAMLVAASRPAGAGPVLATYHLTPGWATFGLVLPQGAAKGSLQAGVSPTQTDVKLLWPDQSIRFAVVTVLADHAGTYAITESSGRTASEAPGRPDAVVLMTTRDGTWSARFPAGSSDHWLSGALVTETRALVTPVSSTGRAHAFMRVLFDVRSYAGGGHRVDVTVENVLDVPEADQVTYDVTVQIDAAEVFKRSAVTHPYLARWRRVFPVGVRLASVTPDFRSFIAAGALPQYLPSVTDMNYRTDGERFDILQFGDIHLPMNDVGGRHEIAPYPDWVARYLVHRRPDQLAYMLAHGDLAGSVGIHLKEPDGVRLVSIDAHPQYWLDTRANEGNKPRNNLRGRAPSADNAHQPSLAYVPYLVTGDRYYGDEMKYWANFSLLETWQDEGYNQRHGSEGLLTQANQVRGMGWALRNMGDTIYLPEADPERTYLLSKVRNNLVWLQNYADTFVTPFGTFFTAHRPENESKPTSAWIALWEHEYLAWALDHLRGHGLTEGDGARNRIAGFQVRLFLSEHEGYPPAYGAPYVLAVGSRIGTTVTYFTTMKQVFSASFGTPPAAPTQLTGYWGPEARLMVLIGLEQGWPGAQDAYKYLTSYIAPDGSTLADDLARRAGWAIAAPTTLPGAVPATRRRNR
jgi:hypothetical protein